MKPCDSWQAAVSIFCDFAPDINQKVACEESHGVTLLDAKPDREHLIILKLRRKEGSKFA